MLGFHDLATLRETRRYPGPFPLSNAAISPDGKILAGNDAQSAIRLWDAVGQVELATVQSMTGVIGGLEFSRDGKMLAVAGANGRIELWDLVRTNLFVAFETRQKQRNRMRFSRDGSLLAVASTQDFMPEIWNVPRKEKLTELVGHEAGVNEIVLTGDNKIAATASWDGTMKLWDVATRKELASFHGQLRGYRCVAISNDDRRVAVIPLSKSGT